MDARRCGGAALAAVLAIACAAPSGTAHAAQLVRTYAQGEPVPSELVLDGEAYGLSGWEPGGGLEAATRTFERTAYKTVAAADYGGDPEACFDAEMEIAEEGFSGTIPLVSAKAEVSASHPERSDYEEAVEFSYITKAELDALPAKRKATVAGRDLELGKLDVQADRVPSDPGTEIYSGRAVYGIHDQRDVADEYRLEAAYAGELSRGASPGTVVATYEPKAAAQAEAEPAEPGPEPAREKPQPPSSTPPWAACAPVLSALAACAATAAVCVRAARRRGPGCEGPEGDEEEQGEGAGPGAGRPEEEEVEHADHQE